MNGRRLKAFAVTLWFALGSLAVGIALYLYALVFDASAPAAGSAFWLLTESRLCAIAALSGLMVDALRWVAASFWPSRPPFAFDISDILRQNLAG